MRRSGARTLPLLILAATGCGACDCGGGEPAAPRDDGAPEAAEDGGVPDVPPEADAGGEDRSGIEDGDEGDGADAPDVPDAPEWGDCGRDIPLWEREVGEEWCYDPPTRDLNPFRNEPSPGCEQVSFCGGSITMWDGYDVWGDIVVFLAPSESVVPGVMIVDTISHTEELMIGWIPGASEEGIRSGFSALAPTGAVVAGMRRVAIPSGTYVLHWDRPAGRQRLIYADPEAGNMPSQRGLYNVDDLFGSTVLAERHDNSGADTNLRTIDVETLENLPVTDFPGGIIIWDAQMWDDLVVFSGGSQVSAVSLTDRAGYWLAPNAGAQWDPAIHGRRVCWEDLRHGGGDPGAYHEGEEIFCMDVDTGDVWNASNEPGVGKRAPTVFGDWVAWEFPPSSRTPMADIRLYNRRLDRRWTLTERAAGLAAGFEWLNSPRLWEPYVYFLGVRAGVGPRPSEIYRCRLPDLFPEAYE